MHLVGFTIAIRFTSVFLMCCYNSNKVNNNNNNNNNSLFIFVSTKQSNGQIQRQHKYKKITSQRNEQTQDKTKSV